MHRVLKQALGQAVKWKLLIRNPVDAVDPPKTSRGMMQTYDLDQTAQLIEAMRPTRMLVPTLLAGPLRDAPWRGRRASLAER
jgi:hypothetical protein